VTGLSSGVHHTAVAWLFPLSFLLTCLLVLFLEVAATEFKITPCSSTVLYSASIVHTGNGDLRL